MSANILLAVAFPVARGLHGGATTIADLAHTSDSKSPFGIVNNRREAVALIVEAQMERGQAHGHGNEAKRRAGAISQPSVQATYGAAPSPRETVFRAALPQPASRTTRTDNGALG